MSYRTVKLIHLHAAGIMESDVTLLVKLMKEANSSNNYCCLLLFHYFYRQCDITVFIMMRLMNVIRMMVT